MMKCIYVISVRTNPREESPEFAYAQFNYCDNSVFFGDFYDATMFSDVESAEKWFNENRSAILHDIRTNGYDRSTLAIKKLMFRTMKDL